MVPASAMRPKATSQGLNSATARRVIGNVRLNETTPTRPSSRPSLSRRCNAALGRAPKLVAPTVGAGVVVAPVAVVLIISRGSFKKSERSFENRRGRLAGTRRAGALDAVAAIGAGLGHVLRGLEDAT